MVSIIKVALRLVKALIISRIPYPSSSELDQLTADVWNYALKKLDYDLRIDDDATSIVSEFLLGAINMTSSA